MQRDLPAVSSYPVNEMFDTIQGEASFTGTPATFIRLQGCGVGCPWCDTKHTWELDPAQEVPASVITVHKLADAPSWASMSAEELVAAVLQHSPRHVVITGGEPCQYDLEPLIKQLEDSGRRVQVETSATELARVTARTWVTVSPKFNMPGGRPVLRKALLRANEFKMPVGKPRDVHLVLDELAPIARQTGAAIWLQPLSLSPRATALCIETATRQGWRVSLQTHKFIGVR